MLHSERVHVAQSVYNGKHDWAQKKGERREAFFTGN